MATLEDIAKSLGVSKSTVSKALSGAGDVSSTMRKAVLEAAVEMGYSRLRRGDEAPRIAVFITNMEFDNPEDFGYDILVGFRKLAEPAGYHVSIIKLDHAMEERISYDTYMMQGNYRGGLFLGLSLDHPWLKEFETCKTPTVLYDNRVSCNPNVTYVGADNTEGMYLGIQHLKKLGHKKIGYLSSALGAYVYQMRYQAFFDALKYNKLPCDKSQAKASYHNTMGTEKYLPELMEQGCTAIVCSHDVLANQLLKYCQEHNIRVPEDVSIIGFDDLPLCETTVPPLTTIRQDRTELGRSAYCALSSQMAGVPLSTFLLHTTLVRRDSCAPLPAEE